MSQRARPTRRLRRRCGHAQAAVGRSGGKEVLAAGRAREAVGHLGDEEAGGDGVGQHAARVQLDGQFIGQVVEGHLAGAVAEGGR